MKHYAPALAGVLELKGEGDPPVDDDPNTIVTKALDGLRSTLDERFTAIESKSADFDKIVKRLDAVETKIARPGVIKSFNADQVELERKAFTTFIRKGREALGADEVKSLRISDDTQGGYLAPAEFVAQVDKDLVQFSPVRQAARVGSTSSSSVQIPRRTGAPTAIWVGETETRSSTESAYGQIEIPINEAAVYVDVSNQLLEDSAVNIVSEVSFDLAEEFGRLEGAAFVNGDGVKKPLGLLADSNVAYTAGGVAAALTDSTHNGVDALLDLYYALNPYYRQRGVWMANGSTIAALRKLKSATEELYLWQPSVQAGQPDTFLGRPVVEAVDMDDIGAGKFPIIFGDFASAYRIYDRVSLSLLRDPYSQATSGLTRFHARRRVGARVVRAEAVRKLKISTT